MHTTTVTTTRQVETEVDIEVSHRFQAGDTVCDDVGSEWTVESIDILDGSPIYRWTPDSPTSSNGVKFSDEYFEPAEKYPVGTLIRWGGNTYAVVKSEGDTRWVWGPNLSQSVDYNSAFIDRRIDCNDGVEVIGSNYKKSR